MAPTPDMMDMIQLVIRETIKKELSLKVSEYHSDNAELQLYLGEEAIGEPYYLSLTTESDDDSENEHLTYVKLEVS
jgi:hypothetical protein